VGLLAVGGTSVAALVESVLPRYALAETISFTDTRIHAQYVTYPSPRGAGEMRGYLVKPTGGSGPWPAVLVIHENRGLNPYIEDVARRAAVEGFIALAPDGLTPLGGYPGNDDDGRRMQSSRDPAKLDADMIASAYYLKKLPDSTGKLGAIGFCWGGGMVSRLAAVLGPDLNAGVAFYGVPPKSEDIHRIKAHMLLQYAGLDKRVTGTANGYETALKANGVDYEAHIYDGVNHGFHNDSTPRYDEAAAKLAEKRTWAWLKKYLA
jgi:carboxymethylenebutenolidase